MNSDARRIERIVQRFEIQYGETPDVVVRAPGRVNLIGEHTDYNGLPVLPMAVDRSILVAATMRGDQQIEIESLEHKYQPREYMLEKNIPPYPAGDWGNYHKAAAQGLVNHLGVSALLGGRFLFDGNIPPASGLASSSALVVASALALLSVNECSVRSPALAELLAKAENYVGTLSGGMDQAVCLLAEPDKALRIDFDPLRTRSILVPPRYAFIACHSLVTAEKSGPARIAYNRRVIECRLALVAFERALGSMLDRPLAHLGDLTRRRPDYTPTDWLAHLANVVPEGPIEIGKLIGLLGMTMEALQQRVGLEIREGARFELFKRVRHVLTEAERVEHAQVALEQADWRTFAALMAASHASCRDDYDISCEALEQLIVAAKASGALASRLTGAGFGGCTINLVAESDVNRFITLMDLHYYRSRPPAMGLDQCHVLCPSTGAGVFFL